MKKKICYLVEDGRFSGPVVQIINILINLKEYFDQTFIFSSYKSEKTIEILKKKKIKYIPLETKILSSKFINLMSYFFNFFITFNKNLNILKKENFELAFVNGSSQFKFLLMCWMLKIKIIWCINDAYSNKILKFFISLFSFFPNHIVFVSENSKNFYLDNFFSKKKGIDIISSSFYFEDEPKKNISKNTNKNFIVGSIGNISPIKNYEYMIEIAILAKNDNQNITFIIGGTILDSQKKYYEELIEKIRKAKLDNIIFKNFVEDTPSFYQSIDVYACYSKSEASPTSVWEAMFFEKPIICSDVGDLKKINSENPFGYVIKNFDRALFYQKILELKNNKSLLESFSKSSYKYSMNFSSKKISKKYLEIFNTNLL